jgi:hypothetical protein
METDGASKANKLENSSISKIKKKNVEDELER